MIAGTPHDGPGDNKFERDAHIQQHGPGDERFHRLPCPHGPRGGNQHAAAADIHTFANHPGRTEARPCRPILDCQPQRETVAGTAITGRWCWISVDIPGSHSRNQFTGNRGGDLRIGRPYGTGPISLLKTQLQRSGVVQLRWLSDGLEYELEALFHAERSYFLMDLRRPAIYPAEIRLIRYSGRNGSLFCRCKRDQGYADDDQDRNTDQLST